MSLPVFLVGWLTMMAAMMLPSTAPLVLLFRRSAPGLATAVLLVGYLAVWASFGLVVYVANDLLPLGGGVAGAAALAMAGLYQLSPFKAACLARCRSPFGFLLERWRAGVLGALRLGAAHGLYRVGCCWALMAVLVVTGSMVLAWVGAIGLVVAAEKVLPAGEVLSRATAVVLPAGAVVVVVD